MHNIGEWSKLGCWRPRSVTSLIVVMTLFVNIANFLKWIIIYVLIFNITHWSTWHEVLRFSMKEEDIIEHTDAKVMCLHF